MTTSDAVRHVLLAFAALGHSSTPNMLEGKIIKDIAARVGITPAQVALSWAVQRGTAFLTTSTKPQRTHEYFELIDSGVPGFIPRANSPELSA